MLGLLAYSGLRRKGVGVSNVWSQCVTESFYAGGFGGLVVVW